MNQLHVGKATRISRKKKVKRLHGGYKLHALDLRALTFQGAYYQWLWIFQVMLRTMRFSCGWEPAQQDCKKVNEVRDPKGLGDRQVKTDRVIDELENKDDRAGDGDMDEAAKKGALIKE